MLTVEGLPKDTGFIASRITSSAASAITRLLLATRSTFRQRHSTAKFAFSSLDTSFFVCSTFRIDCRIIRMSVYGIDTSLRRAPVTTRSRCSRACTSSFTNCTGSTVYGTTDSGFRNASRNTLYTTSLFSMDS